MSLFTAREELLKRDVDTTCLGSWAWRQQDPHGGGAPIPGNAGLRFDSLGLFAAVPVLKLKRWIIPHEESGELVPRPSQDGKTPEFACHVKSQGYWAKIAWRHGKCHPGVQTLGRVTGEKPPRWRRGSRCWLAGIEAEGT